MATTEVEVYNMALSLIGTYSSLTSTADDRREAEVCTTWFDTVRDRILRCAPWPGAEGYRRLSLTATRDDSLDWEATDPAPGWTYAYAVPNDFLWPRYFSTFQKFNMSSIGSQRVIVSNEVTPILSYTKKQTNVAFWDPDLTRAIAFDLAAHIERSLTGSIQNQLSMMQAAQNVINEARAAAANLHQEQFETVAPWIAARGFSLSGPQAPYLYPSAEYSVSGFSNIG